MRQLRDDTHLLCVTDAVLPAMLPHCFVSMDLTRFLSGPSTHLSGLSFEGQRAFPAEG